MASQHHALTTYQQAKNSYYALSESQNHPGCGGNSYYALSEPQNHPGCGGNSYYTLSEPQNHPGCGGKENLCHLSNYTLVSQITDCHFTN
jgi:hypothetical protein